MNVYFLVEGSRTEMVIYPEWLAHLTPKLNRINDPFLLNKESQLENTYYIFSGSGYPSLLDNHLVNAVKDVNKIPRIDYFVICLDSDNKTIQQTKDKVLNFMKEHNVVLNNAQLIILVQNCCIETWLLGNRKVFLRTPTTPEYIACVSAYNVKDNDPELMESNLPHYNRAQYHEYYLKQMFRARTITYSKKNPGEACKKHYLDELIARNAETKHINSFGEFIRFCSTLN